MGFGAPALRADALQPVGLWVDATAVGVVGNRAATQTLPATKARVRNLPTVCPLQ